MPRLGLAGALVAFLFALTGARAEPAAFNPDTDASRIRWTELARRLGPPPEMRGRRFGAVIKTPTNEYWRLMTAGYRRRAAADGVKIDIQAAQSETDHARQLSILQTMVGSGYAALMISPISALNLRAAIDDAAAVGVPVVNVDGAVSDGVRHFVGPINRDMGVAVAEWFIRRHPAGGKVTVIEGQAGVLSTVQRSAGFRDTLRATGRFEIVASAPGDWDRRRAFEATRAALRDVPDLIGVYCNNDMMALGALDAVKEAKALGQVAVFGSDGTTAAYASIAAGELTGTVDIFPALVGEIGLEVAERLSARQPIPRVVETPQVLITRDNIVRYNLSESERRTAVVEDRL